MLALYRIHICIAWYAVKSWHNKYSNTFKELQCFQLWAWQGVGRGGGAWGVREDAENSWWGRSMEKFSLYQQKQQQKRHCTIRLMFFREFECIRLVTKATPTRIAHTHTHTDTHAVAARRQENVVVNATDQKFQVFEWKRETSHCCQGECWPAVPLPHPFFSFSPDKWAACLLRWLKCFASACHLNFNAMDRNVCNKLKGCTGA